jgi:hypothetical protein
LYQVEGKEVSKYIAGELWVTVTPPLLSSSRELLCSHLWGT